MTARHVIALGLLLLGSSGWLAMLVTCNQRRHARRYRRHAIQRRRQLDWQTRRAMRRIQFQYEQAAQLAIWWELMRPRTSDTPPNTHRDSS